MTNAESGKVVAPSAWAPLMQPVFLAVWLATVVSNIGTWLSTVGTSWLMMELSPTPFMVALVQVASTLPIFLLALLAGALADILDRRRLLVAMQVFMAVVAALLAIAVYRQWATPDILLLATFALGIGSALAAPAFQAIVPDLVPKADLQAAIALNAVGINIARAVGPALAGLVIVAWGIAAPFLLNAVSFLGVILVFLWWRAPQRQTRLPAEHLVSAMRSGLRYAREAPALRATLAHTILYFVCASGYWALLPLIARRQFGGGPGDYGILLGCIGVGAVAGALILPPVRRRMAARALIPLAALLTAAVSAGLAVAPNLLTAVPLLLIAGFTWIAVLSTLNIAAQVALPDWVKARGLSIYLVVLNGSLALGGAAWGMVADRLGLPAALLAAAGALLLAAALGLRWQLPVIGGIDLSPSRHWPEAPAPAGLLDAEQGPVMVEVVYDIAPEDAVAFASVMAEMGRIRRRDGAILWWHFIDAGDSGRHVEVFLLESWLQHLRQHERVTRADQAIQERLHGFHRGEEPPKVVHLLPPDKTDIQSPWPSNNAGRSSLGR